MSVACGIVGLPNVGKTTIFGAITEQEVERSEYMFSTTGAVPGTVNVPDERLEQISEHIPTQKIVPAQMSVVGGAWNRMSIGMSTRRGMAAASTKEPQGSLTRRA